MVYAAFLKIGYSKADNTATLLRWVSIPQHHSRGLGQPFGEEVTFSPCSNKEFMLICAYNPVCYVVDKILEIASLRHSADLHGPQT
jgi:hypothetical protein